MEKSQEDAQDKRKRKTSRACIHCQKSHMPCDDNRPCQRCVKRNIASTCRDGRRKKAKYLADVYELLQPENGADRSLDLDGGDPPPIQLRTSQPITPPEGFSSVHIGDNLLANSRSDLPSSRSFGILNSNDTLIPDSRFPSIGGQNVGLQQSGSKRNSIFGSKAANQEYSIISNILRTTSSDSFLSQSSPSSLMTDEENEVSSSSTTIPVKPSNLPHPSPPTQQERQSKMADLVSNGSLDERREASAGLFDDDVFGSNGWSSWKYRDAEDVYQMVTRPYPYTHEFHGLITYLKSRFDKKHLLGVARAMAAYRPSFIANTKRLKESDLIFMEQCFQRTLIDFEKIIAVSGTPTVIWRRTGQIVAVGEEFCLLTEWPRSKLVSADRFIVELMDDNSVSDYFDVFSRLAFGDSRGVTMTECTLLKPSGDRLQTACTWSVRRDVFDIPMMIIGNFLPILK